MDDLHKPLSTAETKLLLEASDYGATRIRVGDAPMLEALTSLCAAGLAEDCSHRFAGVTRAIYLTRGGRICKAMAKSLLALQND